MTLGSLFCRHSALGQARHVALVWPGVMILLANPAPECVCFVGSAYGEGHEPGLTCVVQ